MSLNRYEWLLRTITFHDHNTVKADFLKDMYVHMRWVLTEFEKNARQYYQHTEFVVIDETLTLFRMSLFWVAHRWGSKKALPFLKSVTLMNPALMKLGTVTPYLKKIQKYINHVTHCLSSADISIFHQNLATFVKSRNTDTDCMLINHFNFFKLFFSL